MADATFTSEQEALFVIKLTDGRGRVVGMESITPASSDETVVRVEMNAAPEGDNTWGGKLVSVAPGTARVVLDIDADLGPDVRSVLAEINVTITLDERTNARLAEVAVGDAVDKAL